MGEAHASQAQASQTQVFAPHRTAVLAPRQRAGPQRADQRPALDVAASGTVLAASAVAAGARAFTLAEDPDASAWLAARAEMMGDIGAARRAI
jgi:hypothetical protein